MNYILTSKNNIKLISKYLNDNNIKNYNNLHLAYGVSDKNCSVFVTVIYYVTDCMKQRDNDGNDTLYAVIIDEKLYPIRIKSFDDEIIFISDTSIFNEYETIVKNAIYYSENNNTYNWRNNVLKKENPNFDLDLYNKKLINEFLE